MRPLRIELEGFMAYRRPQTLDLTDLDFFSLSGPTGSGKSSLIDAMIFALYGRVPRLGARSVAPVISSGAERARVMTAFESGGETYTAVRSVKRTAKGAHADEVRLEKGDEVLASGADAVTAAVTDLLSLGFDDFTKTVVLPQGEFAEFLDSTPGQRQDLLRNLLAYDFTEVRSLAGNRAELARGKAEQAEAQLATLALPDDETIAVARGHLEAIVALAGVVGEREEELADLQRTAADEMTIAQRAVDAVERLGSVAPPPNLESLEQTVGDAKDRVEELTARHDVAQTRLDEARAELNRLPAATALTTQRGLYDRRRALQDRLAELGIEEAGATLESARAAHAAGVEELAAVVARLDSVRGEHAAHELRDGLVVGEPCPVCLREVAQVPESTSVPELENLEQEKKALAGRVDALRLEADEANAAHAAATATRAEVKAQIDEVDAELHDALSPADLAGAVAAVQQASDLFEQRRVELEEVSRLLKDAERALEDSAGELEAVDRKLIAARESVADLAPPPPTSNDPIVRWKELMTWREDARREREEALVAATKTADEALSRAETAREALVAELSAAGIEAEDHFAVAVARAQGQAEHQVRGYEDALATAAQLSSTASAERERAEVATALAAHLKVSGFEKWLMAGALSDLVDGANGLLELLSVGGYSLDYDDGGTFEVVDHRSAGEKRPVSTLSGGETFLVSMALALSLAEMLSGSSGAELSAIFLDEGFGALDEETLETVAAVLEELAGKGLMVGVISHVKELAARAPARFEVRRTPTGSVVEAVS